MAMASEERRRALRDPPAAPRPGTEPAPPIKEPSRRRATTQGRGRSGSVLSTVKEASPDAAVLLETRHLLGGQMIHKRLFNWHDYYPLPDWVGLDTIMDKRGVDRVCSIDFSGLNINSNFVLWGRTLDLLPQLAEVDLSNNNRLYGSINAVTLPKVVKFNISNTRITGTIKELALRLPVVQDLTLDNSGISGSIAHLGSHAPEMRSLSVMNTTVSGRFVALNKRAPHLTHLNLSGSGVTGTLLDVVSIAPNTRFLDLSRSEITVNPNLTQAAHGCSKVEFLNLVQTPTAIEHEDKVAFMAACPALKDLRVSLAMPNTATVAGADGGAGGGLESTMCIDGLDEADWGKAQARLRFFARKTEILNQKNCLLDLQGAGKTDGVGVSGDLREVAHVEVPEPEIQPIRLSSQLQIDNPSDPLDSLLMRLNLLSRYGHKLRADSRSCDLETLLTLTPDELMTLGRDMRMKHPEAVRFRAGVQAAAYALVVGECEKRYHKLVACLVGNSEYQQQPLPNTPGNDVAAFADLLGRLGYETIVTATNCDGAALRSVVKEQLLPAVEPGCLVLFFFAGHGAQLALVEGQDPTNYLVGVDNDVVDPQALADASVAVPQLVEMIQGRLDGQGSCCLLLDTCRDGPHVELCAGKRGLAVPEFSPPLFAVMYSGSTGLVHPEDMAEGQTSTFCRKFIECCEETVDRAPTSIVHVMSKVSELMGNDYRTKGIPPLLLQAYEEKRAKLEQGSAWTSTRSIKGKVGKKVNWHPRVALEHFDGVECDDARLVRSLDLTNSYLRLQLSQIAPLLTSRLTTLVLARNPGVQGDLLWLKDCTSLAVVNVGHTAIGGDISVFARFSNLRELVMPETQAEGDIQTLEGLKELTVLNLRLCKRVTGSVFFLKPLLQMQEVDLRRTSVSGNVDIFRYHRALTKLSLSNTSVSGSVEGLKYCRRLRDVDLRGTEVTGTKDDFARAVPCFTTM